MLRQMKDRLLGGAAVMVDRAVTLAVEAQSRSGRGPRIAVSHEARVAFLERIALECPSEPAREVFVEPEPVAPALRRVRDERGLTVFDASWPSQYVPRLGSYRDRYVRTRENQVAAARLFRNAAGAPRPVVVIVHGYMSGNFPIEERLWPIQTLDELGFDSLLFVLPFHGLRANPKLGLLPEFPGTDPRMSIEGFLHAVFDLRACVRWLRAAGHPSVGLFGMSLGGYTAALAATVEPELSFLVPLVPLASLAEFAREQGSLSAPPAQALLEHQLLERLYRPISPLSLPSLVPPERVLVIGARADRVTPIAHARRLATHFSAPLVAFRGGHLLQLGRRESFERVYDLLRSVHAAEAGLRRSS
jgi:pimeloyl-ACP methyl ester carboxylesterase